MVVRYLILPYADINPKTRYTAEQALNHPWVNGSNVKANNLLQSPRQIKKIMEKHNAKFGSSVGGSNGGGVAKGSSKQQQPQQSILAGANGTSIRLPAGTKNYGSIATTTTPIRVQHHRNSTGGGSSDGYDGDSSPSSSYSASGAVSQRPRKYTR